MNIEDVYTILADRYKDHEYLGIYRSAEANRLMVDLCGTEACEEGCLFISHRFDNNESEKYLDGSYVLHINEQNEPVLVWQCYPEDTSPTGMEQIIESLDLYSNSTQIEHQ